MVEFNPPPGRAMELVAGRYRQLPTLLAGFRDDAIVPAPSVAPFQPPATVEDLLERCGGPLAEFAHPGDHQRWGRGLGSE